MHIQYNIVNHEKLIIVFTGTIFIAAKHIMPVNGLI